MKLALTWLAIISLISSFVDGLNTETFEEQLHIRSLQDGRVSSTFSFKTVLKGASPRDPSLLDTPDVSQNYNLFPLTLGQILRETAVTEMHLTLNAGSWDYDRWGYPEEKAVGTGAELWAWMGTGSKASVDERWKGLRNALAGAFCASIGSLDEQRTTSPTRSYHPQGLLPNWNGTEIHALRHASSPSEHVCTENLTPFLKLLPCKSSSGIAKLLNPHRLFDADWHGMGVHVLWLGEAGIEVRLTFQTVMNPLRSSIANKRNWSFHTLFDRIIERNCPAATSSNILVNLPEAAYSIKPEPSTTHNSIATHDVLKSEKPLDVDLSWADDFVYPSTYEILTPFSVTRTLKGYSQAYGTLSLTLKNHQDSPLHLVYLETMPWHIQFYLHTLQARVEGSVRHDIISDISYTPAIPHSRPTTFQTILHLPPRSVTHITMDVDKAFLRYTEHPPDAQRGWDLPPAVLTPLVFPVDKNSSKLGEGPMIGDPVYTSTLLVDVATPDFSMPYNVIIFSCSLIAFIFGSIFNLLTRRFVVLHLDPNQKK